MSRFTRFTSFACSDDDEAFTVTAFDANHCPGAIMLLFEGSFGKVLHTGDCRLTIDCLNKLPQQYIRKGAALDCLYLDCTFGKEAMVMPSREDAIQQVIRCIWNHSGDAMVNLACDILGQESLLYAISETFGMKIYVDKDKLSEYHADLLVVAPDLLTSNKESTRFHICEGFPKLYERAERAIREAKNTGKPEPLFIRPSAQWYTYDERLKGAGSGVMSTSSFLSRNSSRRYRRKTTAPQEAEKDESGVWHVCLSMHSSRWELEEVLNIIKCHEVISTTPHCRAKEVFKTVISIPGETVEVNVNVHLAHHGRMSSIDPIKSPMSSQLPNPCTLESRIVPDHDNSPAKRKWEEDLSSSQRVVPLFGLARYGLPPSPAVTFPSPCTVALEVTFDKKPIPSADCTPAIQVNLLRPTSPTQSPQPADSYRIRSSPVEAGYGRDPSSSRNANSRAYRRIFGVPRLEPLPSLLDFL